MKKAIIVIIAAIAFVGFKSIQEEKKLKVELTQKQWETHVSQLLTIQKIVQESNLPFQQGKFSILAVDSVLKDILPQLRLQLLDSTAVKPDTKKKKQ